MKRFILLMITFVLIFAVSGCAKKPILGENNIPKDTVVEETDLALLQKEISDKGNLMGVAYLGWLEGDMETACRELADLDYTKDFSFIKDIDKYAENDGYRMYLIVPADESVSISVSKCEFGEEHLPYAGEELVSSNEPILVRGNMSDTIPNLYVTATKGSEKIGYTPVQSGMDGRLENSKKLVYDITPYASLPEFSAFDRVPDVVFCGSWMSFTTDGNGKEIMLNLTIEPDGKATCVYETVNSEIMEQFEGSWILDENDILNFELKGDQYACNPSFEWEMTADGLTLKHIGGDEILDGTNGKSFDFFAGEY